MLVFSALLIMLPFLYAAVSSGVQAFNRWEMLEQLEHQRLQTITLTSHDQYHWVEKGRELRINGRMFDVESFSEANGVITLQGLYDADEDQINAEVREFFNRQEKQSGRSALQQLLSLACVEVSFVEYRLSNTVHSLRSYNEFIASRLPVAEAEMQSPPPRWCSVR